MTMDRRTREEQLRDDCMSREQQLEQIRENGYNILRFSLADEEMWKVAIQTSPSVISWHINPSEDLQLLALTLDSSLISSIRRPTENVKMLAKLSN